MLLPSIVWLIFSTIDFIATFILIGRFGIQVEANPLAFHFLEQTNSAWGLLWVKIPVLLLLCYISLHTHLKGQTIRPFLIKGVWVVTGLQICVAIYATGLVFITGG